MSQPWQRYPILAGPHRTEEVIKRSRFITSIDYAPSVDSARSFIATISAEFADASHNCWAYLVGPPGTTGQVGMSDAGEPHGTAGRPMLTVLQHADVGDVVAVVTRYFGGTLLGKGGLVKAYSGGVQRALALASRTERVPSATVELIIDYSTVTPFQRMAPHFEVEVLAEEYSVDVGYSLRLPLEQLERFTAALTELTNGLVLWEVIQRDDIVPLESPQYGSDEV